MKLFPVIMAGGVGSRLWPVSRAAHPKQFQALVTEHTMFEETALRLPHSDHTSPPLIVCNKSYDKLVHDQLAKLFDVPGTTLLEPEGRNTAPVAICASLAVQQQSPAGIIALLPADQHVQDTGAFVAAINQASALANDGYIATIGIKPNRPETGFGYIRFGSAIGTNGYDVDSFVEKPDLETAKQYLSAGNYAWNAGIFVFRADALLAEAATHAPEILEAATRAFEARQSVGPNSVLLDPDTFSTVPSDSIDYAIMEKTSKAAVVGPVDMGWSDVGSWQAVRDLAQHSADDRIYTLDCENTHIRSDGPFVAGIGLKDMIVVATDDSVVVLPAERSQDIKNVIAEIKSRKRSDLL